MVHGPSGPINYQSVCMKDGRCTKRFPKKSVNETITNEDGYQLINEDSQKWVELLQ